MSTFPTDAEREATERAIRSWTLDDAECIETQVDTILDALTPLVADRERAAAARALREAALDGVDTVECCASGRCEVCSPGFVWGRDG